MGERINGVAMWFVFSVICSSPFLFRGQRDYSQRIVMGTDTITQTRGGESISIHKKGMWATVIHYQPQDYNEWVLRSPGPNPKQIRIKDNQLYLGSQKMRISGDYLGRKVCAWAGIQPIKKTVSDE
jgi:hypothetical protein